MNIYLKKASLSFVLMLLICVSYAQKAEVFSQNDKAIKGYDPVAYFTDSKHVVGKDEFELSQDGANLYFASQKILDWTADQAEMIKKVDENWPTVKKDK